jgi:hypothetical protein
VYSLSGRPIHGPINTQQRRKSGHRVTSPVG